MPFLIVKWLVPLSNRSCWNKNLEYLWVSEYLNYNCCTRLMFSEPVPNYIRLHFLTTSDNNCKLDNAFDFTVFTDACHSTNWSLSGLIKVRDEILTYLFSGEKEKRTLWSVLVMQTRFPEIYKIYWFTLKLLHTNLLGSNQKREEKEEKLWLNPWNVSIFALCLFTYYILYTTLWCHICSVSAIYNC